MSSGIVINVETLQVFTVEVDGASGAIMKRVGDGKTVHADHARFNKAYRGLTVGELELYSKHHERAHKDKAWMRIRDGEVYFGRDVRDTNGQKTQEEVKSQENTKVGVMKKPDPVINSFKRLVLADDVKESITLGLHKIRMADFLNNVWNLKSVDPMVGKAALNFYGPAGTGKTAAAMAVALQLGKSVLQVDYSQSISKYVGETGKNIKLAFEEAKRTGAILFFDEADAMLSKRMTEASSVAQSMNSERNILLQEMDAFDGVMIFTTNFFDNFDEAALRRIAHHVEFKLPDADMRMQLIKSHIPKEVPKAKIDFKYLGDISDGLSGGDIKNVCVNAIIDASMGKEKKLKQSMLEKQIGHVRKSKSGRTDKVISLVG